MAGIGFDHAAAAVLAIPRGGAPAPVTNTVIGGDSISSNIPDEPDPGIREDYWSYPWADLAVARGLTVHVRAENSRSIGTTANLNDNGNTLMGNVAEDIGFGAQLIYAMIGANGQLGTGTTAAYTGQLVDYFAALKAANPAVKFCWSAPISYNPTGTPHPNYTTFTANRATLLATCRNPAVWGAWCDFYSPMGEYPDFADAALAAPLFGDSVHPTGMNYSTFANGQNKLFDAGKAVLDTLTDAARANATAPYASVWPASETSLATSTEIVRRFIVSGLAHAGTALGIGVSGSGAQIRVNGGAYGTSFGTGSGNGYRLYNGDVIDLKLTTNASADTAVSVDLTIGSETRALTYRTSVAVDPVTIENADFATAAVASTTVNFTNVPLTPGVNVLAFTCYGQAGSSSDARPTSCTITPSAGGAGIGATLILTGNTLGNGRAMAVYVVTVPGTPGGPAVNYTVATPRTATATGNLMTYVTLRNADPVPVQTGANCPAAQVDPKLTDSATVPALGIALGWLRKGVTEGDVNSPTVLMVDEYFTHSGSSAGFIAGYRTTTGTLSFDVDTSGNGFGQFQRGFAVFKAVGT